MFPSIVQVLLALAVTHATEHVVVSVYRESELVQRISDVCVYDGLVLGEPVVLGAAGLEGLVV